MTLPFDPMALTRDDLLGAGVGLTSEVVCIKGTNVAAKLPTLSILFGPEVHEIEQKVY